MPIPRMGRFSGQHSAVLTRLNGDLLSPCYLSARAWCSLCARIRRLTTSICAGVIHRTMIAPAAVKEDGRTGRPLRVLLSSYACRPGGGSEGGAGWSRALETARRFETHVLCGEGEPEIRRWLSEHGEVPGLRFHFLPPTQLERRLVAVPGLLYAAYRSWQRRAFQLARALHAEHRFDLVHQATLSTYREPGYLWRLGIPFVWGPIRGPENYPWRFLP